MSPYHMFNVKYAYILHVYSGICMHITCLQWNLNAYHMFVVKYACIFCNSQAYYTKNLLTSIHMKHIICNFTKKKNMIRNTYFIKNMWYAYIFVYKTQNKHAYFIFTVYAYAYHMFTVKSQSKNPKYACIFY